LSVTQAWTPSDVRWRSTTARLLLIYASLFVTWTILLIAVISWRTSRYLDDVVDQVLIRRVQFIASVSLDELPEMLIAAPHMDLPDALYLGVFDPNGQHLLGQIQHLPAALAADGKVHSLALDAARLRGARARGVAVKLGNGSVLLLAREYGVVDRVSELIRYALLWALPLLLIPGLLGGILLGRGPLLRVRRIETAIQPIMRGDLGARLPVSARRDELDALAVIINRMLEQIERLLAEVKGVSDSISHDLRTPLTRLRAQLYRLQRGPGVDNAAMIEHCIGETDALLDRFRALLRISELEDLNRRAAFREIDVGELLHRVQELYAPVADDKSIHFTLEGAALPLIRADADLLFEALTNLVSNALKFTPVHGQVILRASVGRDGARIEVSDSGPGIAAAERDAVLHRFYRSTRGDNRRGFGLGLSIVAAIVRLHGFRLEIGDSAIGGARISIYCSAEASPLAA
jgi:signal transduction histidine kinase